jgi:hypothetical protein
MTTLIQRLRGGVYGLNRIELCHEAADEIERLTAENDQLQSLVNEQWKTDANGNLFLKAADGPHGASVTILGGVIKGGKL